MPQFLIRRGWHFGLLLLLIVAGGLRFASYNFSLPYLDTDDESNYYLAGLEWRGLFDNQGYYEGVPPAYIALQTVLQPPLEALGARDLASTTQALRFIAVIVNLATLILIALTARRIAGDLAGVIAGFAWGISPIVLENGVYALPDPFVYLFTALALWLAVEALIIPERRGWCVWSAIAGLLAVLMKYPALPALIPGGLVALWTLYKDRQRGLRLIALQGAVVAAVGLWLVFIYGIDFSNLQREGATVQSQGLSNMLNFGRLLNNLHYAIIPLQPAVWLIVCALGVAAFFSFAARRIHPGGILLSVVVLLTIPWLAASFSHVAPDKVRYVLPATATACVLMGVAVGQVARVVPPKWIIPTSVVGIVAAILIFVPPVRASLALVADRQLPELRVELRRWFDVNLEPGTVIVDADNRTTFNPIWGGIPHRHWVDWWETSDITEFSAVEWRERGLSYAVIPRWQVDRLSRTNDGQAYLDTLLHLRDLHVPPAARGPQMSFYRLWPMDVEQQATFGDSITLLGYDQSAEQVAPNESLTLRFYWQAAQTPADNYSLFVHLVPLDEYEVLAQADGSPAVAERPTLSWDDPDETLISPPFTLTIPDSLALGTYRVFIGLYNYTTGQRLAVDGTDALLLTEITVVAP